MANIHIKFRLEQVEKLQVEEKKLLEKGGERTMKCSRSRERERVDVKECQIGSGFFEQNEKCEHLEDMVCLMLLFDQGAGLEKGLNCKPSKGFPYSNFLIPLSLPLSLSLSLIDGKKQMESKRGRFAIIFNEEEKVEKGKGKEQGSKIENERERNKTKRQQERERERERKEKSKGKVYAREESW